LLSSATKAPRREKRTKQVRRRGGEERRARGCQCRQTAAEFFAEADHGVARICAALTSRARGPMSVRNQSDVPLAGQTSKLFLVARRAERGGIRSGGARKDRGKQLNRSTGCGLSFGGGPGARRPLGREHPLTGGVWLFVVFWIQLRRRLRRVVGRERLVQDTNTRVGECAKEPKALNDAGTSLPAPRARAIVWESERAGAAVFLRRRRLLSGMVS